MLILVICGCFCTTKAEVSSSEKTTIHRVPCLKYDCLVFCRKSVHLFCRREV